MSPVSEIRREFAPLASPDPIPPARTALIIASAQYLDPKAEKYLDRIAAPARATALRCSRRAVRLN